MTLQQPPDSQMNYWLFQANPKYYDLRAFIESAEPGAEGTWTVTRYGADMRPGDGVVFWQAGPDGGICALGSILSEVHKPQWDPQNPPDWISEEKDPDKTRQVDVRFERLLPEPVPRQVLLDHPVLSQMLLFRQAAGTNFKLTKADWDAITELADNVTTEHSTTSPLKTSSWYHLPVLALTAVDSGRTQTTDLYARFATYPDFSDSDRRPYKHQPNQPMWQQNLRLAQQQLKSREELAFVKDEGWYITASGVRRLRHGLEERDETLVELGKIGLTIDQTHLRQ